MSRPSKVPGARRGRVDDSAEYHSPVGSPTGSINSGFYDVRNDTMDSSVEISGKFHSPRHSPVRALLAADDSDEIRNNGFYSPIPSPVPVGHVDDIISSNSFDKRSATLSTENGNAGYHSSDDTTALLKDTKTHVYLRRWYVLAVFSLGSLVQGFAFGTYGPIAQSLKRAFLWTDSTIALLCMWNNLSFVAFAWPLSKVLEKKGMRFALLLSMMLVTVATGLRCVSSEPTLATWLNNISNILTGAATVVPYSACALLSALWFPVHQRTTATAIATFTGYVGIALSFVIGPLVVLEPDTMSDTSGNNTSPNATDGSQERNAIMVYFYSFAAFSAFITLVAFIYFPSKPKLPPTISASVKRLSQREGLKSLLKNIQFQLILIVFAFTTGIYTGFSQILDIDLDSLDISQTRAGWVGFYSIIGGCLCGVSVSWISDMFSRKLKVLLVLMFIPCAATSVWFLLLVQQYIPYDTASLYITGIIPGSVLAGVQPLFYELACEAAYPAGEDVSTFLLTTAQNLVTCLILGVLIVPGSSVSWINWVMTSSVACGLVLLLLVREDYNRLRVDDKEVTITPPSAP